MSAKPAAKAAAIFPAPMKPTLMLVTVDATGIAMIVVRFFLFSDDDKPTCNIQKTTYFTIYLDNLHF